MGEIPERALFRQPVLKKPLVPYLKLVQGNAHMYSLQENTIFNNTNYHSYCIVAVRIGDLSKFQEALAKYAEVFRNDKNYTLILRFVKEVFFFIILFLFLFLRQHSCGQMDN